MHIPDNYLSPATCAVMGAAMLPVWALATRKVSRKLKAERIPLLGIGAAYSFLIMMFNVPLPGGTTGHVVGATLLAVLLGPWAATISLTIALLIQALLFGDGGILSFGANCFNMAFVMPFFGYGSYRLIADRVGTRRGRYAALAVGSYLGINAAALAAALEFGLQPLLFRSAGGLPLYCPYPFSVTLPAMLIPHALVAGPLEALFTVAVLGFVRRASPATIRGEASGGTRPLLALLAALGALSPLGLLAAGSAWGEWGKGEIATTLVGGKALGYVPEGLRSGFSYISPAAGYEPSGLPPILGYLLSAVAGAALLVVLFKLASVLLARRRSRREV